MKKLLGKPGVQAVEIIKADPEGSADQFLTLSWLQQPLKLVLLMPLPRGLELGDLGLGVSLRHYICCVERIEH